VKDMIILDANIKKAQDYWNKILSGDLEETNIPLDYRRSGVNSRKRDVIDLQLPDESCQRLMDLTQNSSFLIYTVLMSALKICLYNYVRNHTIVVGSPAHKDFMKETYQVNRLPIVDRIDGSLSFRQILLSVRQSLLDAYAMQAYPFDLMVKDLGIKPDNKQPLFNIYLSLDEIHQVTPDINNDVVIEFRRNPNALKATIDFNARIFKRESIERFSKHFQNILQAGLKDVDVPIWKLRMLTQEEIDQLTVIWNDTRQVYTPNRCVHQLFEAQAEHEPDSIAVVFEKEQLTYRELNSHANRLAHYLRKLGVGPDVLVGICIERSLDMAVGLLAILKAGGAYVPFDPRHPSQRLSFILEDAGVTVLLASKPLGEEWLARNRMVICLDSERANLSCEREDNLDSQVAAENLAYVLYTSGSTGRPKGVAMSHGSLSNLMNWQRQNSTLLRGARTLQFASLNFDVSFQEIFATWCAGGALVLVTEEVRRDPAGLLKILTDMRIERLFLPFVALQQLAEVVEYQTAPSNLREIITAGEQLQITPPVVALFRQFEDCSLYNQYGPTESHVVTAFQLDHTPSRWPALPPIGRPIANTQIYLLDSYLQLVPAGVVGELYIGGIGLARGYINRPDLTAEKFIPNSFARDPGARMYRTGDTARYSPDGSIEFLGRVDHQVKIRGIRIELGEIEVVLGQHPALRETAIVLREDTPGDKRLVAYFTPAPDRKPSTNELRSFLKEQLPEYMLPSTFVMLEALPLTPTGKVDRRSLPQPEGGRPELASAYVAPQTEIEQTVATIWQDTLHLATVGIYDNFFDLGGHSLLMAQVRSRLIDIFHEDISMIELFKFPTISALSKYLLHRQDKKSDVQSSQDRAVMRRLSTEKQRKIRQGR
jgi:surfactin family lipopeptide synthetase A